MLLYPVRLRPRLKPRRWAAKDPGWWREAQIDPEEAAIGGEAAGEILTGHLRAADVVLYVTRLPETLILRYRLKPDPGGGVEILDAFWPLGVHRKGAPATGEARNIETARLIRGEHR